LNRSVTIDAAGERILCQLGDFGATQESDVVQQRRRSERLEGKEVEVHRLPVADAERYRRAAIEGKMRRRQ
jgi:hypothetical protein